MTPTQQTRHIQWIAGVVSLCLILCGCKTSPPVTMPMATNGPITRTSALPDSLTPGKLVVVTTNTFPPGGWDAWRLLHPVPTNLSPYMFLVWSNPPPSSSWPVNNGIFVNWIQSNQGAGWSNFTPQFIACAVQCFYPIIVTNTSCLFRIVTASNLTQVGAKMPMFYDAIVVPTALDNPQTPCCARDWLLATNSVKLVLQ
jgi:hypothetical protein